jgi:hypothetical protein
MLCCPAGSILKSRERRMGRLNNSKEMVKLCFAALRADGELMVFAWAAFFAVLVVTAAFALALYLGGMTERLYGEGLAVVDYLVFALYYLLTYFVVVACGAALVAAALERLRGGHVTLAHGLRAIGGHLFALLGYSVISATAGVVLGLISSRGGTDEKLGTKPERAGWNVLTTLTVPILVTEGGGPVGAMRRSETMLRKTWGDRLAGSGGVGVVFGLLTFVVLALGTGATVTTSADYPAGTVLLVAAIVALLVAALGIATASLAGIFRAALYDYAQNGTAGAYFQEDVLKGAFTPKSGFASMVGKV